MKGVPALILIALIVQFSSCNPMAEDVEDDENAIVAGDYEFKLLGRPDSTAGWGQTLPGLVVLQGYHKSTGEPFSHAIFTLTYLDVDEQKVVQENLPTSAKSNEQGIATFQWKLHCSSVTQYLVISVDYFDRPTDQVKTKELFRMQAAVSGYIETGWFMPCNSESEAFPNRLFGSTDTLVLVGPNTVSVIFNLLNRNTIRHEIRNLPERRGSSVLSQVFYRNRILCFFDDRDVLWKTSDFGISWSKWEGVRMERSQPVDMRRHELIVARHNFITYSKDFGKSAIHPEGLPIIETGNGLAAPYAIASFYDEGFAALTTDGTLFLANEHTNETTTYKFELDLSDSQIYFLTDNHVGGFFLGTGNELMLLTLGTLSVEQFSFPRAPRLTMMGSVAYVYDGGFDYMIVTPDGGASVHPYEFTGNLGVSGLLSSGDFLIATDGSGAINCKKIQ